jgi:hypothetical protein
MASAINVAKAGENLAAAASRKSGNIGEISMGQRRNHISIINGVMSAAAKLK